jgi:hypothetical protein
LRTLAERERGGVHEGAMPAAGEWRHSDLPGHRPEFHPRAVAEREVRRVKSLAPTQLTPEQAALEMTALSYDFFLFHDATSGADSLLYRAAEEAVVRLNGSDDRFVFFSEPPSGRGAVLYCRYDGHYGLLTTNSRA